MTNEMSLSFSATLENEPFVRTCIASFVVCLNPTVDEIVEIKTVVGEAVSNAIIHGYNGDKGCLVKVKAYIEDDLLTIYVIDKGQGIQDIEKARQPMFTSKKELEHAGMGLSIIEALCDEMTIESSLELGTQLIMKKRIKPVEIRFIQGLANQIIASPGTMSVTASDKRRQQENRVELVEHLPYKQRVIGSSPIGSISISYLFYGEIAQLARACGSYPQCRGFFFTGSLAAFCKIL